MNQYIMILHPYHYMIESCQSMNSHVTANYRSACAIIRSRENHDGQASMSVRCIERPIIHDSPSIANVDSNYQMIQRYCTSWTSISVTSHSTKNIVPPPHVITRPDHTCQPLTWKFRWSRVSSCSMYALSSKATRTFQIHLVGTQNAIWKRNA